MVSQQSTRKERKLSLTPPTNQATNQANEQAQPPTPHQPPHPPHPPLRTNHPEASAFRTRGCFSLRGTHCRSSATSSPRWATALGPRCDAKEETGAMDSIPQEAKDGFNPVAQWRPFFLFGKGSSLKSTNQKGCPVETRTFVWVCTVRDQRTFRWVSERWGQHRDFANIDSRCLVVRKLFST